VRLIAHGITAGRVNAQHLTLWVQYLYSYRFRTTCNLCPLPRIPLPCISLPHSPAHLKCPRRLLVASDGKVGAPKSPRYLRVASDGPVGAPKCPRCLLVASDGQVGAPDGPLPAEG
jgi:hypothetical protein